MSAADGVSLLDLESMTKGFPGVQALDNVRLDLRHGEVLALVAENGAGKPTLMKLLVGLSTLGVGVFRMNGRELRIEGPRHTQELGISIIRQEFNLMPDLTVAQNIFIGREHRSAGLFPDDRALNRRARELFDRLGLALDPTEPVERLTVARQQMVPIGKARSFDPKVLIMDEPTAALNGAEVDVLFELIGRLRSSGTGAIYISHRMDDLSRISERIIGLRDGRYIDTLKTSAMDQREVISLMVGREQRPARRPRRRRADVLRSRAVDEAAAAQAPQQDAIHRATCAQPLRRHPAEGRHRQVAGQGLRGAHLRRAHAASTWGRSKEYPCGCANSPTGARRSS